MELFEVSDAQHEELGHGLGVETWLSLIVVDVYDLLYRLPEFELRRLLELCVDGCVGAILACEAVLENANTGFELIEQLINHKRH